jgi:shikimate 5-dehydrogenase
MLLYQGVLSFEHFTGKKAPVEIMWAALEKGARKL